MRILTNNILGDVNITIPTVPALFVLIAKNCLPVIWKVIIFIH
jgi:hypothetical protein